jgi:prepilin-type N-terminal cleavage/methylation domain-containing protein
MRKNSGFTLMELMVVIALIGVLASLAVPEYINWLPRYRAKKAAMELSGQLHKVKLKAVKENRPHGVYFDPNSDRYYILSSDGTNNFWDGPTAVGGDDDTEWLVDLPAYGSGVRFASVSPGFNGDPLLIFESRGICNAMQIVVTNLGGSPAYRIQTTLAGAIILDRL